MARKQINLSQFKEKIDRLKSWRDGDDEMLPSDELMKGLLKVSIDAATCHSAYNHYTSVEAFKKIFGKKSGSSIRLSRLSSVMMNDHNECGKYTPYKVAKQTYICCFNHDGAECANLWWLYAKGKSDTLRITFPAKEFSKWCDDLRKQGHVVADVLYAAVRGEKDDYEFERQNTVGWEDQCIRVKELPKQLGETELAGRMKDYEWRSERETRIIVSKKSCDRFAYIEIPDVLIKKMRITTSPWVNDDDYERIKKQVSECLEGRWKCTQKNFRPSVLERTMDALILSKDR